MMLPSSIQNEISAQLGASIRNIRHIGVSNFAAWQIVNAQHMRPERLLLGECRGGEAFDLLQAVNGGASV